MKIFTNEMKVVRGDVHIIKDRCKGCGFCVQYCPTDVLEMSHEFNAAGYHFPQIENIDNCICCGLCEMLCPEFAIWSTTKQEKEVIEIAS